jgi:DNA modification methylase
MTKIEKLKVRPTDINPSYSYHEGDETKNERIKFRHWNDLLFTKGASEKDTTYSSLWLFRTASEIPEFKDPIGSPSIAEAKRKGVQYFSEFNPLVCENIINFWSDENDVILDPFAGRTRGIVAGLKHRKYFGFEISPQVYNVVKDMIDKNEKCFDEGYKPKLFCDDSFYLDESKYGVPPVDCILTCPPYHDLEKYESVKGQLSDIPDYLEFLHCFELIMKKAIDKLKDNGFACIVVGDFRKDNRLVPFDCDTTKIMESLGLVLWDKVVLQNINFGWASFKFGSAKHKRQTAKVTEYLLVFKKAR